MSAVASPRVWSAASFAAVARYLAVGVATGAVAGVVLGLLLTASGRSASSWVDAVVLLSALVGAALSLPVTTGAAG